MRQDQTHKTTHNFRGWLAGTIPVPGGEKKNDQPPHMKSIKSTVMSAVVATAALAATLGTAQAQNPNYADGDLVLFFQNPGGTLATGNDQQLFASLGNTATFFRQAYTDQANHINFLNIGTALSSTFGTGWASSTTLYGGLGGVRSDSTGSQIVNGDPNRSISTSQQRYSVGTEGSPNSDGFDLFFAFDGGMTGISAAIIQQNNILETGALTAVASITNGVGATVSGINPVGGNSWNDNIEAPGVQQQGSASNYGTFAGINNVQFMWDLYRIQAVNDIGGQFGENEPIRQGLFMGTVLLSDAGDLSFVTAPIPEPGTWVAIAAAAVLLGAGTYRRARRRSEAAAA
jgi:hypothetical protein